MRWATTAFFPPHQGIFWQESNTLYFCSTIRRKGRAQWNVRKGEPNLIQNQSEVYVNLMLCWRTWTSNVSWYIFEFVFVSYVYICIIKHNTFQFFSITFALRVNSSPQPKSSKGETKRKAMKLHLGKTMILGETVSVRSTLEEVAIMRPQMRTMGTESLDTKSTAKKRLRGTKGPKPKIHSPTRPTLVTGLSTVANLTTMVDTLPNWSKYVLLR